MTASDNGITTFFFFDSFKKKKKSIAMSGHLWVHRHQNRKTTTKNIYIFNCLLLKGYYAHLMGVRGQSLPTKITDSKKKKKWITICNSNQIRTIQICFVYGWVLFKLMFFFLLKSLFYVLVVSLYLFQKGHDISQQ